jgi:hypothetical protein
MENNGHWTFGGEDRREALIAALPPLLFGVGSGLAASSGQLAISVAAWLLLVAVLIGGGLLALARRLPDWGYTWLGAAMMVAVLLVKALAEELAETGRFLISPAGDAAVTGVVFLVGLIVLIAAALRGWQWAGLVSIGLSSTLGLSIGNTLTNRPFQRYDLALMIVPLGLVISALTYLYVRGKDVARVAALIGVWCVNSGIIGMALRVWQPWFATRERPTPFWPVLLLSTGMLLAGPFLGLLRLPLRRLLRQA